MQEKCRGCSRSVELIEKGETFLLFFALQNTGTSIWSNNDGYTLTCTSNIHGTNPEGDVPSCMGRDQNPVHLGIAEVIPGSEYVFSM